MPKDLSESELVILKAISLKMTIPNIGDYLDVDYDTVSKLINGLKKKGYVSRFRGVTKKGSNALKSVESEAHQFSHIESNEQNFGSRKKQKPKEIKLTISVWDSQTESPIDKAEVKISNGVARSEETKNGKCEFKLPPGEYIVTAVKTGYKKYLEKNIRVFVGVDYPIYLEPEQQYEYIENNKGQSRRHTSPKSTNNREITVEVKNEGREPVKSAHVLLETNCYYGVEIAKAVTNEEGKCKLKIPEEYGRDEPTTTQFCLIVKHTHYKEQVDPFINMKHSFIQVELVKSKNYAKKIEKSSGESSEKEEKLKNDTYFIEKENSYLKSEGFALEVYATEDGEPSDNALVVIKGESKRTVNGKAVFENLSKDSYTVKVSKEGYRRGTKTIELDDNKELKISLSRKVVNLQLNVTDNNRELKDIKIEIGDKVLTTDSNGVAEVELPLGSYQAIIQDPYGIYKGGETSLEVVDDVTTKTINLRNISPEIQNIDYSDLTYSISDLKSKISSVLPETSYDQYIPKYLLTMFQTFYTLGENYKENISLLRGRYNKKQIIEHLNGIDEVSSAVCEKVKNLLTTRESLYILTNIRKVDEPMGEEIKFDIGSMVNETIEKELNGTLDQEVIDLGKIMDESITQSMRDMDVYYFSSLFKITKDFKSNHANPVIYIILETIKTMIEDEKVKERLKRK